jgi:hypothetical protein
MAVPPRYGLSGQSDLAQMPRVVWLASMPQSGSQAFMPQVRPGVRTR